MNSTGEAPMPEQLSPAGRCNECWCKWANQRFAKKMTARKVKR